MKLVYKDGNPNQTGFEYKMIDRVACRLPGRFVLGSIARKAPMPPN
ncbi:MAG: hypothetical protein IPL27_10240 [Lewinellaceae bacterium]|nr:hypothetical protein [Lewinellaceae bacterium]